MKRNTNTRKGTGPRTHEGAPAIHDTPLDQLRRAASACMLWENTFYESGEDIATRLMRLAHEVAPQEVASLALELRIEHGVRHASLLLARMLLNHPRKGELPDGAIASTVATVVQRADELAELLVLYKETNDGKLKPVPAALRKGLARAFKNFDEYQLAKYNRKGDITLQDAIRLVHPRGDDHKLPDVIRKLAKGESLKTPDTWETALSGGADKKETFTRLLEERKLGYLACLRNLRNMENAGVDRGLVKEALARTPRLPVLPFQFLAAAKEAPWAEGVLDDAMLRTAENLPKIKGRVAILIDTSGSMNAPLSKRGTMLCWEAATGVAIGLRAMADDASVFHFATRCEELPPRKGMALVAAVSERKGRVGHGTNIGAAVRYVASEFSKGGPYDVVFVITDMQSRDFVGLPEKSHGFMMNVATYKNAVGYKTQWTHIDGFSQHVLRYVAKSLCLPSKGPPDLGG